MGYYDGKIERAAALSEDLTNNHPFVDGNKRAAFAATDVFLRFTGSFINCDSEVAFAHLWVGSKRQNWRALTPSRVVACRESISWRR